MNVNPQLQYLQQQQQQPQQVLGATGLSPQVSQLQLQQQQLQRQQLLNQHLQQQTHSQLGGSGSLGFNPAMTALGNANNGQTSVGSGMAASSQNLNPVLQLQLQQQLQQQQQQQPTQQSHPSANFQPQRQLQLQPHQAPTIKEVWSQNLEYEFQSLRSFIEDRSSDIFIAIHQEIPGIVVRPVGSFKSSSDYHFQTLRSNSDLLNIIQLSLCVTKINRNETSSSVIWQFNFYYDLNYEMYNEEHLAMLSQTSQINFPMHMAQGIKQFSFAELLIESGLLLDDSINWISYHAGYDLGFFISLLMNKNLPDEEKDFYWWCSKYFPNFYDLKFLGNQLLNKSPSDTEGGKNSTNKPSIEYLAEELQLLPISPAIRQYFATSSSTYYPGHQQQITSTLHAYLSMECFKELLRKSSYDPGALKSYKGIIWGLGNIYGPNQNDDLQIHDAGAGILTPSGSKGFVHFGRPLQ
ncbi:uncharacterized protein PRCAT00002114001 [Priceomyces carsonii]|uniref:uncharacterized protein n=1 Tax=Priceomyces carsonii TaxID=28549 RepID=UPI002EDAFB83|nr:unnamed protein product [Priceomyces carsonii]